MKYEIKEIKEFILRCYASAGQNSNSEDAALLINLFCREVETNWKRHIRITNKGQENESWNLNEVFYFIDLGLSKVFGDYFGINLITFKQFEHAYSKNENSYYRKQYLLKNPLPVLEAIEQHTESGKDEIVIDAMISKLKSKNYTDADLNVWYDFLEQKGAIKLDRWKQYKTEGAEKYTKELHKRSNFAQHNNLKDLYNEIKKALDLAKESKYDAVELTYHSKVHFMELTFCNDENINKLETFLKTK
jgi:hypothetical protein